MAEKKGGGVATKVTSIRLDTELHERALIYGIKARPKRTLTAILNEALAEYLKKRGA